MGATESPTDLTAFRALFPGVQRLAYFDVAARGLVSLNVRSALDRYLDMRMYEGADKERMFAAVEEARNRFAALINARADEIAFTKNVSDGINAFATALPWKAGDNVVLCEALEHPANIFIWHALRRTLGIEIKVVAPRDDRVPLEGVLDAIDGRTRLVAVSSVSFSPGYRFPVPELGRECRSRGILLLVDAAQSVGILKTDVVAEHVDAMAVSTQKGLLGMYGMGVLFVRSDVASELVPAYLSRMGIELEGQHEAASGDTSAFRYAAAARRFDVGNFNYAGVVAVEQSIRDLEAVGAERIESHVCGLAAELAEGLRTIGIPVLAQTGSGDATHIVPIGSRTGDGHDSTEDEALLNLHRHLEDGRVRHTIRRGVLRLSLHAYNDGGDVERVVDLARDWMRLQGSGFRAAG